MLDKIKSGNIEKLNLIFKIIYLVHLCFCFTVLGAGNKITLVLTLVTAIALILYRTIMIKKYIKFKNLIILVLFLLSYIISSIFSMKYGIFENVQCFTWIFMQITLLYTFDINQENTSIIKEFRIVASVLVGVISIIDLTSLILLFCKISSYYTALTGEIYIFGVSSWGRLYGIATDPNYISVVSSVVILLSIYFIKTSKVKIFKILNILSIIIQFLFIAFAGSRTALVSIAAGLALYALLLGFQKIKKHKVIKTIPIIIITCLIFVIGFDLVVKGYNYLDDLFKANKDMAITNNIETNNDLENEIEKNDDIKIGREDTIKKDMSNRRFDIWKSGFEIFKTNWIIGTSFRNIVPYTLENLPNTYIVNNDFAIFNAFHNTIIDVLVAQGIIGIIIVLYFSISTVINVLKNRKNIVKKEEIDMYNVLLSICALIVISAMFLSHIFYVNSPTTGVFWLVLGYLTVIIEKNKK